MNKTWHWLSIICAVGVVLRVALPAHAVFANGQINFLGPDSYWRMQNAREIVESGNYGFNYDSLLAILGNASIIVPVLFAVAVIIMVYFIALRLFGRLQGLVAAAFIAVWPNEFFARSMLGAVDHHALEVFLTTGAALIVILIITQKRLFTRWTLLGAVGIALLLFAYKGIWSVFLLPFLNQSVQTLITTAETAPLGASGDNIAQLDFMLAIIAVIMLVRNYKDLKKWLMVVWLGIMLIATIYQVRFDYYLAVPLAVMVGFTIARMMEKQTVKVRGK